MLAKCAGINDRYIYKWYNSDGTTDKHFITIINGNKIIYDVQNHVPPMTMTLNTDINGGHEMTNEQGLIFKTEFTWSGMRYAAEDADIWSDCSRDWSYINGYIIW